MKRILCLAAFVMFSCITNSKAMDPVTVRMGQPESAYNITNSTISVSSTTVTTIAAVDGYRKILIRDITASTSFFYRLDWTTTSVTTAGFLNTSTEVCTIESNAAVYLQLAVGVAAKVFNVLTFRK